MSGSVRKTLVAVLVPVALAIVLSLSPADLARGWLATATFAAFWIALVFAVPLTRGKDIDTATYSWFALGGVTVFAVAGVLWGGVGLALIAFSSDSVDSFVNGRLYGVVSLLLACGLIALPAVFRRKAPLPGPEGPIVDPRAPVRSHEPPVLRRPGTPMPGGAAGRAKED